MGTVGYVIIFISSSMEYLSVSVPGFVDALAEARTPVTFLGYSITGLAQLVSTTLIAYKAWYDNRLIKISLSLLILMILGRTGRMFGGLFTNRYHVLVALRWRLSSNRESPIWLYW